MTLYPADLWALIYADESAGYKIAHFSLYVLQIPNQNSKFPNPSFLEPRNLRAHLKEVVFNVQLSGVEGVLLIIAVGTENTPVLSKAVVDMNPSPAVIRVSLTSLAGILANE